MNLEWISKFENKKIVLLGFGVEGKSTFKFLKQHVSWCEIQVMDQSPDYVESYLEEDQLNAFVYSREDYLNIDSDVDYVFKSPGIPYKQIESHIPRECLTSQTNEFVRAYREKVIGITGTKGKSMTSTFLYELLKKFEVKAELVGNIGKPAFDYVGGDEVDYYVYEMSSHQLETAHESPSIGVVLNLFEEHLDHYHSYEHYGLAKLNVSAYQLENDLFICGQLESNLQDITQNFSGKKAYILSPANNEGVQKLNNQICVTLGQEALHIPCDMERILLGEHNLVNMAVAVYIAMYLGYKDKHIILDAISKFKGLPHRLSFVRKVNGVSYYNDSISTIPLATIAAYKAIANVDTIILGGMDRGINYEALVVFLNEHPELKLILLPDSGHKIYKQLLDQRRCFLVDTMEEAVTIAADETDAEMACLLSPAAASYGFFKNFEDRGNQFEALVRMIK